MKYILSIPGFKTSVSLLVCMLFLVQLTSCGTILYPERRGLTRDPAQIDVGVVVMDGALLLLFILPGVIAYAVDFSTGCIYLPPGRIMQNFDNLTPSDMQAIRVVLERLSMETLSGIVQQHTGVDVTSNSADLRIFRPDSAQINVQQELIRVLHGDLPLSQGSWYTGEQVTLIADTSGHMTTVGLRVPGQARLVEQ